MCLCTQTRPASPFRWEDHAGCFINPTFHHAAPWVHAFLVPFFPSNKSVKRQAVLLLTSKGKTINAPFRIHKGVE
jgi:hypothetical protein